MSSPTVIPPVIPLWLKLLYTAFMCVLVPVYWKNYGPSNFLYFCDVALFLTLIGIWTENSLFISASAVGILMPQLLWMLDYLGGITGHHLTGMTAYMFDSNYPLFTRFLSFFHFWLPILICYLLYKLGYEARGLSLWVGLAIILLPLCYFCFPEPPVPKGSTEPVNINYVYGLSDTAPPQTYLPPLAWLGLLMVGLPLLIYTPTHFALSKLIPSANASRQIDLVENDSLESQIASKRREATSMSRASHFPW